MRRLGMGALRKVKGAYLGQVFVVLLVVCSGMPKYLTPQDPDISLPRIAISPVQVFGRCFVSTSTTMKTLDLLFVLPLFALFNAGVHINGRIPEALGNPVGLGIVLVHLFVPRGLGDR